MKLTLCRTLPIACSRRCAPARSFRQHASPFRPELYDAPIDPLVGAPFNTSALSAAAGMPLHVEIGSADGAWLGEVARQHSHEFHLGFEIREDVAKNAAQAVAAVAPANCRILFGNPKLSWEHVFPRPGMAHRVSLLHPDPGYKARHEKRRFLAGPGVHVLAWLLQPGGQLLLQTDASFLHEWMLQQLGSPDANSWFRRQLPDPTEAPLGVRTTRERHVLSHGGAVFRAAFARTDVPCPPPPMPVRPPPDCRVKVKTRQTAKGDVY